MRTIIFAESGFAVPYKLDQLPPDMRRMLRMQVKELIYHIEECECVMDYEEYIKRLVYKVVFRSSR